MKKIFSVLCLSLMWVSLLAMNSFSADTDSLVVTENGYVGIGTTNPVSNLEVSGGKSTLIRVRGIRQDAASASGIQFGDELNPKRYSFYLRGTNKHINADFKLVYNPQDVYLAPFAISPTELDATTYSIGLHDNDVYIDSSGNVGIGTDQPISKLTIGNGYLSIHDSQQGSTAAISYNSGKLEFKLDSLGTDGIYFTTNYGTQKTPYNTYVTPLVIKNTGYIGINTNDPQYELDVNGTIRGNNVSPSDLRWKENIQPIDEALERVSQLRGVNYEWIDKSRGEGPQLGVIAQEVEEVFPEAVHTDSRGYKSVEYGKLVAPLIEAVKTLKAENEELKARVERLEASRAK